MPEAPFTVYLLILPSDFYKHKLICGSNECYYSMESLTTSVFLMYWFETVKTRLLVVVIKRHDVKQILK